jgi:uncharacterized protein YndB with AHSA1/START domain
MSELPEYRIDHTFSAPRELVWRAWTDPKLLHRWYGPNVETIIHKFELKPGGAWLNEMRWSGKADFSKMVFQEVAPTEKLVWIHSSSDSNWNVITSPMMPNWPRALLTTVKFDSIGDKTKVRLTQIPVDATAAEIACFAKVMSNMDKGWGSGYAILEKMLAELQSANA